MSAVISRYKFVIIILFFNLALLVLHPTIGIKSLQISGNNMLEMLSVLPPIFVLLGLLDVWVERETVIKLMGEKSGLLGMALAFLLGSAAAGPLYAAFPLAGVLLKKGCKLSNILIFIGAWSTTKIPMLLFEASAMGWKFMLTRFIVNIPGIILIAYIIESILLDEDKIMIYRNAN
ncbi:MAG: permease [Firmicutes bacterium]|nr:permease [Bacillota bacterium]